MRERGRSGKSVALRDIKLSSFKKQACCLLLPWFRTQGAMQKVDIAVYLLTLANVLGSSCVYARFFKKAGKDARRRRCRCKAYFESQALSIALAMSGGLLKVSICGCLKGSGLILANVAMMLLQSTPLET